MKLIAYTSPFVPAEWITAHGLQPYWFRPQKASGQMQMAVTRGICPYAGAIIDATAPGIDACAMVLTTVCDQMRYVAGILKSRNDCPILLLNVPSTWQTAQVRKLYLDELRRLGRFLVQLGGRPPDNDVLAAAMLSYDRARIAVRSARTRLSALQFAEAVAAVRNAPTVIPDLDNFAQQNGGIPLAVVGGPMLASDYDFFNLLEQSGAHVVLDATEGGERTMPRPFDPKKIAADPLQELANAYFDSIPDAFRRPNDVLYDWLGPELAARQVRGIIFRRYVWCDLWHAELHRLKEWSPVPVLEIDAGSDDTSAPNRVQGRIEAFLEMLGRNLRND